MQSVDNSITTFRKRGLLGTRLTSKQGAGEPNPDWIPVADRVSKDVAAAIGGHPGSSVGELVGVPLTAHFMGGACIGDSAETGVIDPYHRLYGHDGLHVVDGSAITANLGVNPSLTITAQAERAMSFWPNKGETDTRPDVTEAYRRLEPIAPKSPVVPDEAPGALRLPIVN